MSNRINRTTTGGGSGAQRDIDFVKYLMYGLVIVLFLGFSAMFLATGQVMIESFTDKRDSAYQLQQKIDDQNNKIDMLIEELHKQQEIINSK